MKKSVLFFYILVALVVACGDGEHMPVDNFNQGQGEDGGDSTSGGSLVNFEEHMLPLFEKHCSLCHVAGAGMPVWTNYPEARNKRQSLMERVVIKRDMPPMGLPPLSDIEIAMVKSWLDSGAPKN